MLDKKAKIIFVSTMISAPWGGSEELWKKAAAKLKQEGHHVFVNVKEWGGIPEQILELQSIGCIVDRRKYYIKPTFFEKIIRSERFLSSKSNR